MKTTLSFCALVACVSACGSGVTSTDGAASAAAIASLSDASDAGSCIAALKSQVYDGSLSIEAYEARALSECGVDFNAPDPTPKGDPAVEATPEVPSAEEQRYAACANAVKAEVIEGTLALADYEATIAARCTTPSAK